MALGGVVDKSELLHRFKGVDTQTRGDHVCGAVALVGDAAQHIRAVGAGIAAVAELVGSGHVSVCECCAADGAVVLVVGV